MRSPIVVAKKIEELEADVARLIREFAFLRMNSSTKIEQLVDMEQQINRATTKCETLKWVLKQRGAL